MFWIAGLNFLIPIKSLPMVKSKIDLFCNWSLFFCKYSEQGGNSKASLIEKKRGQAANNVCPTEPTLYKGCSVCHVTGVWIPGCRAFLPGIERERHCSRWGCGAQMEHRC